MKTIQEPERDRWMQAGLPPGNSDALAASSLAESLTACPQGNDCAGDGSTTRILNCEQGCGFRGCIPCMKVHEDEPHASDSDHMLAMIRDIGGQW
jgi:hypothetical protein